MTNFPLVILVIALLIGVSLISWHFLAFKKVNKPSSLTYQQPSATQPPAYQFHSFSPTPPASSYPDFKYPNSKIVNRKTNSLSLESSDDPLVITNWYKQKIIFSGFNNQTVITNNTNNLILNILQASNSSSTIEVEISRKPGSTSTTINISY